MSKHPIVRPRRLRRTAGLRAAVAECGIRPAQLVHPLFVQHGSGVHDEITSMPGQFRWSVDTVGEYAKRLADVGVGGVILFGIPETKDATGSSAADPHGPVAQATAAIKAAAPDLVVWADVCLCEYTDHGHCGLIDPDTAEILNDPSLAHLASAAVAYADAGADVIAPSDMMDGRVGAIRTALEAAGHDQRAICSYAVKYASAFYGPFRDAAESAPAFGDRRSYQMDPPNVREALREAALDLDEGADMLMVKPAGPYLDVVRQVADRVDVPVAAYQVSGEYSMIRAAAANGWLDGERAMGESLIGIARAGARIVLTYFAEDFAAAAP